MTTVKTHTIYINSNQRSSGTSNDFVISLKRPLTLTNQKNYFRVRISNAIIPHTIKQVNSNNNVLQYTYVKAGVTTNSSITISPGNYTILTLLSALSSALTIANVTLNFTYDRNTGLSTFQMQGTDNINSSLTLKFGSNAKLGLMFGVLADVVLVSTNNIGFGVTGAQNVNVNPCTYLTIRSSSLKQRLDYENIVEKDVYSDVLAVVPINVSPGSFIICPDSPNTDIVNKIVDTLNIYLADNQTYSISLNNLEWSLTLIFEEIGIDAPDTLINVSTAQPFIDTSLLEQQREQLMQELMMMKQQMINQLQPIMPTIPVDIGAVNTAPQHLWGDDTSSIIQ